jgi:hypothetical protein
MLLAMTAAVSRRDIEGRRSMIAVAVAVSLVTMALGLPNCPMLVSSCPALVFGATDVQ